MAIRTESFNPSNLSHEPAEDTEIPQRDLCGEPKYFPMEDDLLGLSYELNLACGVPKQEGVERFRRSIWDRQGYPSCLNTPKLDSGSSQEGFWKGLGEFIQESRSLPFLYPGIIY